MATSYHFNASKLVRWATFLTDLTFPRGILSALGLTVETPSRLNQPSLRRSVRHDQH